MRFRFLLLSSLFLLVLSGCGGGNSTSSPAPVQLDNAAPDVVPPPAEAEPSLPSSDPAGTDLIPPDGSMLTGTYLNVGRFLVPQGATVRFSGELRIEADSVDIIGSLQGEDGANITIISRNSVSLGGNISTTGSISISATEPGSSVTGLGQLDATIISISTGVTQETTPAIEIGGGNVSSGTISLTGSGGGTILYGGSAGDLKVVNGGSVTIEPINITPVAQPVQWGSSFNFTVTASSLRR